jgi:N-sulfoglucosamine sulfohydrolase
MNGTSFLPVLEGKKQPEREYVFTEYHRTHGRKPYPMRAVQGKRFGYLVNFWANRTGPMWMESMTGLTFNAMKEAAKDDPEVAARVKLFEHRVLEEFFDFEKDPDAMHNLIDSPEHQDEIAKMRAALAAEMKATDDPALEAFLGRDDPAKLDEFMKQQETRKKH